jgi:hypothetical protein
VDVAQGFFSLLRWRPDVTRDEAKNVAVLLVAPGEGIATVRAVPISGISSRLKEQGLVDSILVQLAARLEQEPKPDFATLQELHDSIGATLYVTEPRPVAVADLNETLTALYRAFLSTPGHARAVTKGVVLDRVVESLRRRGLKVERGGEIGDFLFDAVVKSRGHLPNVFGVLSFAAPRKDWTPVLHDAGHFLYALERVEVTPKAVIQPPSDSQGVEASAAHKRVRKWLDSAQVESVAPAELEAEQQKLMTARG